MKKWYIFERSAEGSALFFVRITQKEYETICRFLSQQDNGPDEGYSGSIGLFINESFKTRKEAEEFVKAFWRPHGYI